MKITLKRTPEQVELIKAMASRNKTIAYEAQVALAEFIGPVLAEVLNQAPTVSNLFQSLQFNADDNPSIPLDLYYNISNEDYVQVYSQSHAGGLPTSQVLPTASELKLATYSLDSAVSFDRRYAAKSRMDVVSKTFTRVAQEILIKQETTSATLLMTAVAAASTGGRAHVQTNRVINKFTLADMNDLLTLAKRINTSFIGGTPTSRVKGLTDLICSPEVVQDLRSIAYNAINTQDPDGTAQPADGGALAAPDELRMELYRNAGIPEFYGLGIMELNEFGVNQKFNTLFDVAAGSTTYNNPGSTAAITFNTATDDFVLGVDRSRDALIRAVAVDDESGGEFNLIADDQYSIRQNKIGYFGSMEEGRVVLDNRVLVGKIVGDKD